MTKRTLSVDLVRRWSQDALDGWLTGHGTVSETEFAGYGIRKTEECVYEVFALEETDEPEAVRSYLINPIVIDLTAIAEAS